MFVEVFYDEEYRLPDSLHPIRIIDLGAHAGFASIYFTLRDSDVLIATVEPDPNNQKLLLCNTEMFPNIRIIRAAVAREDGYREFFFSRGRACAHRLGTGL